MSSLRHRRIRLTIAHVMVVIALLAIAFAWTVLIAPVAAVLAVVLHRAGFTVAESIVIAAIVVVLVALLLPATATYHPTRNRSLPSAPGPNVSPQRARPAAVDSARKESQR